MDQALAAARHGRVFPLQYSGLVSYVLCPALMTLPLDSARPRALPVVLLGGINLVRCAGLAGIPTVVASADADEPAFASRYCTERCLIPPLDRSEAAVEAIVALGDRLSARFGRRVPLLYGSDAALELLYAHRDRLRRRFLLLVNDAPLGEALLEKDRFQALAEEYGLPVPRALGWDGRGKDSLAGHDGPVLVKPRNKVDWHGSTLRERLFPGGEKARIFASGAEAAVNPVVALFHHRLAFQECIPGGDDRLWSYHGLADEKARVLASFVGRKIRTHPPSTGESAFIELASDEALERVGRDVAARLGLKGVFKMDFKQDARDGRWYLLEINARFNLWHYLGACNGVNLVAAAYDYLVVGTAPAAKAPLARYRWLSLELDWRAYRALAARGELTFPRWIASIACSRNVYNVFAWNDPVPWLRFWRSRLARRARRGPQRMLAMFRQWRSTAS
jgi:predicted ATP-grasp superfamily ATP-dependent carboligase